MCGHTKLEKIKKDHIGQKVQIAQIEDKTRGDCLTWFRHVLLFHWSVNEILWWMKMLKEDNVDLISHEESYLERPIAPSNPCSLSKRQATIRKDVYRWYQLVGKLFVMSVHSLQAYAL